MGAEESGKITGLLKAWRSGDRAAQEELIPLVYNELRELASRYRRKAGAGETMQTTALVNEAYLKLVDIKSVDWRDRVHFFAVSANVMRWILVDRARARVTSRRGGKEAQAHTGLNLDELPDPGSRRGEELIAVDDALKSLA